MTALTLHKGSGGFKVKFPPCTSRFGCPFGGRDGARPSRAREGRRAGDRQPTRSRVFSPRRQESETSNAQRSTSNGILDPWSVTGDQRLSRQGAEAQRGRGEGKSRKQKAESRKLKWGGGGGDSLPPNLRALRVLRGEVFRTSRPVEQQDRRMSKERGILVRGTRCEGLGVGIRPDVSFP